MNTVNARKEISLNLTVGDDKFDFSTSIDEALAKAENELTMLNETIDSLKDLKPDCDKLDYILAASSGALCGIIDIFLVGKPGESPIGNLTDQWFSNRVVDFAKFTQKFGKDVNKNTNITDLKSAIRFLEGKYKIPYDQTGAGDIAKGMLNLNTKNHHFKSLSHNPSLLGLFCSILDQFMNTSHFVSDGQLIVLNNAGGNFELVGNNIPAKIFSGVVNWFGHMMSDICGSSKTKDGNRGMGVPSPLWTWTNDIIAIKRKLGLNASETDKKLNELAENIFVKGFDARFQTAQAIPVFLNELIVRFIYTIRRFFKYLSDTPKPQRNFQEMWKKCEPFSNPTVKRMLTVAHGTFCLVDVGDAVIRGFATGAGNFNVVECVLRLNVAGLGRFAISLYGEGKRAIEYHQAEKEANFAKKEVIIVENYIEGLHILAAKYDDYHLITFIDDFKKSDAYIEAFGKSVQLAQLRSVPDNKILKTKLDIDKYFGG